MSHALIIARRELRERSFVLIAAAVLAVVPFLAALLPIGRRFGATTIVAGAVSIIAPLITIGLALILGASIVGRELSERRMSFYFARPVSASAIWIGKVIASLLLILGSFGLTVLPALAFAYGDWNRSAPMRVTELTAATLSAAIVLFLVAHFASVIIRSRSVLAFVDLLLSVAAILAGTMIVRPLFNNLASNLGYSILVFLVSSLCVTVLLAGAWQLSRGRTDPRANHRELSRATWTLLSAFMILAGAYVAWVLSAKPSDVTKAFAYQAPAGEWMLAGGKAGLRGDFYPMFLMNRQSGEWIRFPDARWYGATFTRTGSAVLSAEQVGTARSVRGELFIQKLAGDRAVIATGIVASPWSEVVVSDDLERLAVMTGETLSIHDVRSDAILASVRLPVSVRSSARRMFFANRDTVRLYFQETNDGVHKIHVYEFEIPVKRLTQTGEMADSAKWMYLSANADGSTLLIRAVDAMTGPVKKFFLVDGRTAQIRSALHMTDPQSSSAFLADGSVAVLDVTVSNSVLRLYGSDGTLKRDISLAGRVRGAIIDVGRSDKLIVSRWDGEMPGYSTSTIAVLDIERGVIEREQRKVRYETAWNRLDPRRPEPNRSGELVITDSEGRVWRWNALTGEKTKLLGS